MARLSLTQLFAVAALAAGASAHMIMMEPPSYVDQNGNGPVISPLYNDNTGPGGVAQNVFPCQGLSVANSYTEVAAGANLLVQLGTTSTDAEAATHGGGVCLFSISYDYPSANSTWKTIYVIMGGCPTAYDGNIPTHQQCGNSFDTGACIRQFDIPFPSGLPSGRASLAWSWLNEIGNPEYYMNCAPVFITGGADAANTSFYDALPPMFVANVPTSVGGMCDTSGDSGVMNLPSPGTAGVLLSAPSTARYGGCASLMPSTAPNFPGLDFLSSSFPATGNPSAQTTIAPAAATGSGGGGAAAAATTTAAAGGGATPAAAATTSATAGASAGEAGVFITVASGSSSAANAAASSSAPSSSSAASSSAAAPAPASVTADASPDAAGAGQAAATVNPTPQPSGSYGSGSISCTNEGGLVCYDANHFGLCDNGVATPAQEVAAGTECVNGQIGYAASGKRMMARGARMLYG